MKRIGPQDLLKKLEALDDRLISVWLQDEPPLSDEERWEIFVTLLESRVSLLKVCRDAELKLTPEVCMPKWLDKLTSSRMELRRRDVRLLEEERRTRKKVGVYETVARSQSHEE